MDIVGAFKTRAGVPRPRFLRASIEAPPAVLMGREALVKSGSAESGGGEA